MRMELPNAEGNDDVFVRQAVAQVDVVEAASSGRQPAD